jgi:hypothetical protein
MSHRPWPFLAIAVSLLLFACSNAPTTSPDAQHFADAKANLQASDFAAALSNLEITIKTTSNETTKKEASLLRVILLTATADADQQMAAAYQAGAHEPSAQGQTGAFYKMRGDYGNTARAYLMNAMQAVMDERGKLDANTAPVALDVAFPGFTGGMDETLVRIKQGQLVPDAERLTSEHQLTRNAMAKVLTALAGAGSDLNKGKDLYGAGKVNVDARTYLVELSDQFLRIGQMFDVRALNEPDKFKTVNQVVEENLAIATKLLATKPDKDLDARVKKMQTECDKCLKKLKA